MISDATALDGCERFQSVAWNWLQSGEITRTAHLLSPLEELAGFNFGFVYLLQVNEQCVKVGYSEHPMRRIRELQPQYDERLKLRACFVGDPPAERFAHRRFANLRIKNELFYAHPIIDEYFRTSREQMREKIRSVHICSSRLHATAPTHGSAHPGLLALPLGGYAELHACSNFTFLEGGSHPEELVEVAASLGLDALALTDRDGLYGAVRFARAAADAKLPGIIGSEVRFADASPLVLLVQDAAGYANLCEIVSAGQLRGSKNEPQLQRGDLDGRTGGLIALCNDPDPALLREWRERFGDRLYVEVQHHLHAQDARRCRDLIDCARELQLPLVATNGVMYARKEHARLADVLFCIKNKTNLTQAREDALLRPNAEYYLKSARMMAQIFAGYPQAIRNTLVIAESARSAWKNSRGNFRCLRCPKDSRVKAICAS